MTQEDTAKQSRKNLLTNVISYDEVIRSYDEVIRRYTKLYMYDVIRSYTTLYEVIRSHKTGPLKRDVSQGW